MVSVPTRLVCKSPPWSLRTVAVVQNPPRQALDLSKGYGRMIQPGRESCPPPAGDGVGEPVNGSSLAGGGVFNDGAIGDGPQSRL